MLLLLRGLAATWDRLAGPLPPLLARREGAEPARLDLCFLHLPLQSHLPCLPEDSVAVTSHTFCRSPSHTTQGRAGRAVAASVHPSFLPAPLPGASGWDRGSPLQSHLCSITSFQYILFVKTKGKEQSQPLKKKHVHHETKITYTIYRNTPRYKIYVHALSTDKPRPLGWAA